MHTKFSLHFRFSSNSDLKTKSNNSLIFQAEATEKPVEESTQLDQEATAKQVDNKESEMKVEGPSVRVIGVETRAQAEGGGEWQLSPSATLGLSHSRPTTPIPPEPEPHNIFLKGSLPSQSQLLVEDAATELLKSTPQDPARSVILSGKMTLSLISVDAVPNPDTLPTSDTDPLHEAVSFP